MIQRSFLGALRTANTLVFRVQCLVVIGVTTGYGRIPDAGCRGFESPRPLLSFTLSCRRKLSQLLAV